MDMIAKNLLVNKSYLKTMESALRLLIVDDSKIMREALTGMFADDENVMMETASNGLEALALLSQFKPDVITLDINMPDLDGISTLKRIMIEQPVPTVMLSSLTQEGAKITFDALRYGAVDFIAKPTVESEFSRLQQAETIISHVKNAAEVELSAIKYIRHDVQKKTALDFGDEPCKHLVTIGAAEGGYGSLLKIIPELQADSNKSYLVSLHVPAEHVDAFIGYLNACSMISVEKAENNAEIRPGCCYICSGSDYMTVFEQGENIHLHVNPAPFSSRRGAIDMMMFSVVELMGSDCTGVILSGLGEDGVEGIEHIMQSEGGVIIQSPETCLYKELVQNVSDKITVDTADIVIADNLIADKIRSIS